MDDGRCLLDVIDDPDALTSFLDKSDEFGLDSADLEEFSRYQQPLHSSQYGGPNNGGNSMLQETPSSVLLQLENISPPPIQHATVLGLMGDRPFTPTSVQRAGLPGQPGPGGAARPLIDLGFGDQEGGEIKEIFPDFLMGTSPTQPDQMPQSTGKQSASMKDDFASIFSFENENETPREGIPPSSISSGKVEDVLQQSLFLAGVNDFSQDSSASSDTPEDQVRQETSSAGVNARANQIASLNLGAGQAPQQNTPMSSGSFVQQHPHPVSAVADHQKPASKSIPQVAVVRPQTQPQPQPQPQSQVLNSQNIIGSQGQVINSQYMQAPGKVVVSQQQQQSVLPMQQTYVLNSKGQLNIHPKHGLGGATGMQQPKAAPTQPQGIRIMLAPQGGGNLATIGSGPTAQTIQLNQGQGAMQGQQTVVLQQASGSSVPVLQPVITIGATQGSVIFMTRPTTVLAQQQLQQLQTTGSGLTTIQMPHQAIGSMLQPNTFTVNQQPGEKQTLPVMQLVQPGGKAYQTITLPQGYVGGGQTIVIQNPQGGASVLPYAQSQARIVRPGTSQMSFVQTQPTGTYGKVQATPQLIQPKIVSTAQSQPKAVTVPAYSATSSPYRTTKEISQSYVIESTVAPPIPASSSSSVLLAHIAQSRNNTIEQLAQPVQVCDQTPSQDDMNLAKSQASHTTSSQPVETFRHKLYGKISTVQPEMKLPSQSSSHPGTLPISTVSTSDGQRTLQTILQKVQPRVAGSNQMPSQMTSSQGNTFTGTSAQTTLVYAQQRSPPATTVVAPSNINAKGLPTQTQTLPGNNGSVPASVQHSHFVQQQAKLGASVQPTSSSQSSGSLPAKLRLAGTQMKKQNMFGSQVGRQTGQAAPTSSQNSYQAEFIKASASTPSSSPSINTITTSAAASSTMARKGGRKQNQSVPEPSKVVGTSASLTIPHTTPLISALDIKAKQMKERVGIVPMSPPQPMVSALQLKAQQMMESQQSSTLEQPHFQQNQPMMSALQVKTVGGFQNKAPNPVKPQHMMSALELKQQMQQQHQGVSIGSTPATQTRPMVSALQLQEMQRNSSASVTSLNDPSNQINQQLLLQQRQNDTQNFANQINAPSLVGNLQAQSSDQLRMMQPAQMQVQHQQVLQKQNVVAVSNPAQSQAHAIYVPGHSVSNQGQMGHPSSGGHQLPSPQGNIVQRPPSRGQPLPSPQGNVVQRPPSHGQPLPSPQGNVVQRPPSRGQQLPSPQGKVIQRPPSLGKQTHAEINQHAVRLNQLLQMQQYQKQNASQSMAISIQNQVLSNQAQVARPPSAGQPLPSPQGYQIQRPLSAGQPTLSPQSTSQPIPSPQSVGRPPSRGQPIPSPQGMQNPRHGNSSQPLPSPQASQVPRPPSAGQPIQSPHSVPMHRPSSVGQPMPSPQSSQTSRPPSASHSLPSPQGPIFPPQGSFQRGPSLPSQNTAQSSQMLQSPQGLPGLPGQMVQSSQGIHSQMVQNQQGPVIQNQQSFQIAQTQQPVSTQGVQQGQGGSLGTIQFSNEMMPQILQAFELLKRAQAAQAKGPTGAREQAQYMQQFQGLLQKHPDLMRQLQLLKQRQQMEKQRMLEKQQQLGASMPEQTFPRAGQAINNQQQAMRGQLSASAGQAQLVASSILQAAQGVQAASNVLPTSSAQSNIPQFLKQSSGGLQSTSVHSMNSSTSSLQFQSSQNVPHSMNPNYTPNVTIQATSGQKDGMARTGPPRLAPVQGQPHLAQAGQSQKKPPPLSSAMPPPPPPVPQQPPPNVSILPSQKKAPLGSVPFVTKEKDVFDFDDDDPAPPTLETKFSGKAAGGTRVASGTVHHQPMQTQNVMTSQAPIRPGTQMGQSQVQVQTTNSTSFTFSQTGQTQSNMGQKLSSSGQMLSNTGQMLSNTGQMMLNSGQMLSNTAQVVAPPSQGTLPQRSQLSQMLETTPTPGRVSGSGLPASNIQTQGPKPSASFPQTTQTGGQAGQMVYTTSAKQGQAAAAAPVTGQGATQEGNAASRRLQQIQQGKNKKVSKAAHQISVQTQQSLHSVQGFIRQLENIHNRTTKQEAMLQQLLKLQQSINEQAKAKLEAVGRQGAPSSQTIAAVPTPQGVAVGGVPPSQGVGSAPRPMGGVAGGVQMSQGVAGVPSSRGVSVPTPQGVGFAPTSRVVGNVPTPQGVAPGSQGFGAPSLQVVAPGPQGPVAPSLQGMLGSSTSLSMSQSASSAITMTTTMTTSLAGQTPQPVYTNQQSLSQFKPVNTARPYQPSMAPSNIPYQPTNRTGPPVYTTQQSSAPSYQSSVAPSNIPSQSATMVTSRTGAGAQPFSSAPQKGPQTMSIPVPSVFSGSSTSQPMGMASAFQSTPSQSPHAPGLAPGVAQGVAPGVAPSIQAGAQSLGQMLGTSATSIGQTLGTRATPVGQTLGTRATPVAQTGGASATSVAQTGGASAGPGMSATAATLAQMIATSGSSLAPVTGTAAPSVAQAAAGQASGSAALNPIQQIFTANIVQLVGKNLTQQQQEMLRRLQEQLKNMTPQQQQQFYKQQQVKLQQLQQAKQAQSTEPPSTAVQPPQQPSSSTPPAPKGLSSPVRAKPSRSKSKKKSAKSSPKGSDRLEDKGSGGKDVEIISVTPRTLPPPPRMPTPPPAAADFLQERCGMDKQLVESSNFKTPFVSYSEAVHRLLPYHIAHEKIPSKEKFEETATSFEEISKNLLEKKQKMLNQFQMLLYDDSMRPVPSSEIVMLQRMFLQDEKAALQEERNLAEANRGLVESLMPKIEPAQGTKSTPQVAPVDPKPEHTFASPARVGAPKAEPRSKTNHDRIRRGNETDSALPNKRFASQGARAALQRQHHLPSSDSESKSLSATNSGSKYSSSSNSDAQSGSDAKSSSTSSAVGTYHSAIVSKYPSSDEEEGAAGSKGGSGGIRLRLTKNLLFESNVRSRDMRSESEESVLSSPTKPKRRKSRLEALLSSDSQDVGGSSSDVTSPSLDHRTRDSGASMWSVSQSQNTSSQDAFTFQDSREGFDHYDSNTRESYEDTNILDDISLDGDDDIDPFEEDPLQEQMDSAVNSILFLQNPYGKGSTTEALRHGSLVDISFDHDVFDSADDSAVFNVDDYANASFLEENSAIAGLESEFSSMDNDIL